MATKLPWRVYYSCTDGRTFDGAVEDAPVFHVLLIVERCPDHGRRIVSGGDYYCWIVEEARWRAVDFIGMVQYLSTSGWKRVLVGEMVDSELWNKTMQLAMSDPDFPVKTGFASYEHKGEQ